MTLDEHIKQLIREEIATGGTIYNEVLKPIIDSAVQPLHEELIRLKSIGEPVEEYMPIEFFTKKYNISKKTERNVRKANHVGFIKAFKHKHFHVEQWKTAWAMYQGRKPNL